MLIVGKENDIATGDLVFEWNALEHVDPSGMITTLGLTTIHYYIH